MSGESVSVVPEPAMNVLLASGLLVGLLWWCRGHLGFTVP